MTERELREIICNRFLQGDHQFPIDLETRLLDEGMSYAQIPWFSIERKGSASTALKMRNVLSVAHTLLEIAIRRLRRLIYGKTMAKPTEVFLKEADEDSMHK